MGGDQGAVAAVKGCSTSFQSTPPRGGRHDEPLCALPDSRFNPRPRVGGDWPLWCTNAACLSVSIHAPAWGATAQLRRAHAIPSSFQSTPPRGGRRSAQRLAGARIRFNPRPRVGGDQMAARRIARSELFQSTPPRGGRRAAQCAYWRHGIRFNPRPRVGGDCTVRTQKQIRSSRFNPRPRVGGDASASMTLSTQFASFNPRPRVGGDLSP